MNTVYIALGSNQNNPIYHIQKGMKEINHLNNTHIVRRSSLYSSKPLGPKNQPDYINAVIKIETSLKPEELLKSLQSIENLHHRKRIKKWGPRTLDLDILIYDNLEINSDRLTIPHPDMTKREFVLIPLLEITNYRFNIPKYGKLVHYLKKDF
ncbi:MAG: 2-amino-4-hydroxy-6-hydroxymethyldihydropteridine diphosphokinase [Pseudomonadota bacterium]|nr:2-amino-4-hydroxy-6-hydroxymethyldihydropteridine diphosphokinase [Pseudomonadota bacterium]MED5274429.1 2-amino-4-hydroxy-6-hydroxymethyldihydropteridine diphosphokinase [Pseudomonadota bacterium]